jgi:hypothetical protein
MNKEVSVIDDYVVLETEIADKECFFCANLIEKK